MAEEAARSRDNGGEPGMEGAHTGPSGRDPMGAPDPGEYASGAEVEYDDDIDRDDVDEADFDDEYDEVEPDDDRDNTTSGTFFFRSCGSGTSPSVINASLHHYYN